MSIVSRRVVLGVAAGALSLALIAPAAHAAGAPPPTNVRVTAVTDTTATIAFTPSPDPNVDIYHVYANGEYLTWTWEDGREIPDLRPNTRYEFTLRSATSGDGQFIEGPPSNTATATTLRDTTPPGTPELSLRSKTSTSVSLSWFGGGDNDPGGSLTYILSNGTSQLEVQPGRWDHTFTGLTVGQTYTFTVRARDEAGNVSAASNAIRVTMDGTAPTVPRNLRALNGDPDAGLQWDASTDNIDTRVLYNVYRDGLKIFAGHGSTVFDAIQLCIPITRGRYTVTAVDSSGNESAHSAPFDVQG